MRMFFPLFLLPFFSSFSTASNFNSDCEFLAFAREMNGRRWGLLSETIKERQHKDRLVQALLRNCLTASFILGNEWHQEVDRRRWELLNVKLRLDSLISVEMEYLRMMECNISWLDVTLSHQNKGATFAKLADSEYAILLFGTQLVDLNLRI